MIDIDRPSTWVKYRDGLCNDCSAGCCTMPVEINLADLVRLGLVTEDEALGSQKKIFKKLHKEGIVRSFRNGTGLYILSQKNIRDCFYLNSQTRLCTVYEKRPEVCRQFPSIGPRPNFCPKQKK